MHRVAGRQLSIPQNNLFCTLHHRAVDGKNLIYDTEQSVKGRLDRVPTIDGNIAVQDLLQDLGIGDQALTIGDQLFE